MAQTGCRAGLIPNEVLDNEVHAVIEVRLRLGQRVATVARATMIVVTALGLAPRAGHGAQTDVEMSAISGSPEQPRRHSRLRNPERLTSQEAQRIYDIALPSMKLGYSGSGDPSAGVYRSWQRFNTTPYLSATHGNHYVNNYANEIAADYGRFESAGTLPVGSVLAKDSFAVTRTGGILLGPLFLMEKMPAGFSPVSGDWRYSEVTPDGELLGRTGGPGARRVGYCIACHLARESFDHLYFIPEDRRVPK